MVIKVGCCGFPLSRKQYYTIFKVVEVQQTFYEPPLPETLEKWRDEAPDGFEFTIKAWQLITHTPSSPTYRKLKRTSIDTGKAELYGNFRLTAEVLHAWEVTREAANILKAKVIVFQSPAAFQPTDENKDNLRRFFDRIRDPNFIYVWEPRGKWRPNEIRKLCEELGVVDCVDPFKRQKTVGEITYYRLHGKGGYRYQYTDEELTTLKTWLKKGVNYVMFNNVYMREDAQRFMKMLEEKAI